jgi:hypothetical protein
MVRNGCPFTAAPFLINGQADGDCAAANARTLQEILAARPRVVVTSAMRPEGYREFLDWTWASDDDLVEGYRALWQPLVDAGIRVVAVADTPTPDFVGPECLERHGPDAAECRMGRAEVDRQSDALVTAASGTAGVEVLDLTDHLCNRQVCPGVIGNVLVYRDNHVTDTLARSLAPAFEEFLTARV